MNDLPEWLRPKTYPRTRGELQLLEMTYENIFESTLDAIAGGQSVSSIIANDPRNIEYARFLRWVNKSKTRRDRLKEAEEIAAEILVNQITAISDGMDGSVPDGAFGFDSQQAKLKIDTRKWIASKWNPKKYSDKTKIDLAVGELTEEDLNKYSTDDLKRMIIEGEYEVIAEPEKEKEDDE